MPGPEFDEAVLRARLDDQIRATVGASEPEEFIVTLRNYVMGLVKRYGLSETGQPKLANSLNEFLDNKAPSFVTWLTSAFRAGEFAPRAAQRSPSDAGPRSESSLQRLPSSLRAKAADAYAHLRSSHSRDPPTVASVVSRPSTARTTGTRERDDARGHESDAAHRSDATDRETRRSRSRTPPRGPRRHIALFADAIRRTGAEPGLTTVKQEYARTTSAVAPLTPPRPPLEPVPPPFAPQHQQQLREAPDKNDVDPNSVVITNIHFNATPQQVGEHFLAQCGGVVRVTILKNAYGMPKGYAFMELENRHVAQAALAMSGHEFMGRTIKIIPKLRRPPQASVPPWLRSMFYPVMQGLLGMPSYHGFDAAAPGTYPWQLSAGMHGFQPWPSHAAAPVRPGEPHRGKRSDVWLMGMPTSTT